MLCFQCVFDIYSVLYTVFILLSTMKSKNGGDGGSRQSWRVGEVALAFFHVFSVR